MHDPLFVFAEGTHPGAGVSLIALTITTVPELAQLP